MTAEEHRERVERRYSAAMASETKRHAAAIDAVNAEHYDRIRQITQDRDRDFQAHGLPPNGYPADIERQTVGTRRAS